jgi:hypothetical protein
MDDAARQIVERANKRLAALLEETECTLRGEGEFNAATVRRITETIGEMTLILMCARSCAAATHNWGENWTSINRDW